MFTFALRGSSTFKAKRRCRRQKPPLTAVRQRSRTRLCRAPHMARPTSRSRTARPMHEVENTRRKSSGQPSSKYFHVLLFSHACYCEGVTSSHSESSPPRSKTHIKTHVRSIKTKKRNTQHKTPYKTSPPKTKNDSKPLIQVRHLCRLRGSKASVLPGAILGGLVAQLIPGELPKTSTALEVEDV